jgi:hypothetical protein
MQIRLTFCNQGLLKKFQAKSAWKISGKVRLIRINNSIAIVIAMKIFQVGFDEKNSGNVFDHDKCAVQNRLSILRKCRIMLLDM